MEPRRYRRGNSTAGHQHIQPSALNGATTLSPWKISEDCLVRECARLQWSHDVIAVETQLHRLAAADARGDQTDFNGATTLSPYWKRFRRAKARLPMPRFDGATIVRQRRNPAVLGWFKAAKKIQKLQCSHDSYRRGKRVHIIT